MTSATNSAGARLTKPPAICLNMIVKDEAPVVEETLDSVSELIDYWVIVDTGSSDGTQDLIREYFRRKGIPGELHERRWKNFGANRTEALHLCHGKADYAWVIDADDLVEGSLDFSRLTLDAYSLCFGPELLYWRSQVFKEPQRWTYEGVVHEVAVCRDPPYQVSRLEGDYHIVSRRLGDRNKAPEKYERDSRLLLDVVKKDPANARAVFYLAQSLHDAGDLTRALHYYSLRAEMGGWREEVFLARFRSALCMRQLGRPTAQVAHALLRSWQLRPRRAEPLYQLAQLYRVANQFNPGYLFAKAASEIALPEKDSLFVSADVYAWKARDEQAICSFYVGKERESFELCTSLLDCPAIPEPDRERVLGNRDFAVPSVLEETLRYPRETIESLTTREARPTGARSVSFTITSCRRLDLFEKTVNSFLNCCSDLDRIDRWVCIDDGSPSEDRQRMKERYPFFEFIWKTPEQKGHAHSMNRLLETIDPILAASRGRLALLRRGRLRRKELVDSRRRPRSRPGAVQPELRPDARMPEDRRRGDPAHEARGPALSSPRARPARNACVSRVSQQPPSPFALRGLLASLLAPTFHASNANHPQRRVLRARRRSLRARVRQEILAPRVSLGFSRFDLLPSSRSLDLGERGSEASQRL